MPDHSITPTEDQSFERLTRFLTAIAGHRSRNRVLLNLVLMLTEKAKKRKFQAFDDLGFRWYD